MEEQIRRRGVRNARVIAAMLRVPRHRFVPLELIGQAYEDRPLPIGFDQTISQPYIIALMLERVRPKPDDRALEVGTGCGYLAAVLAELVQAVTSIEIVDALAQSAQVRLAALGYSNVMVHTGDGYFGRPDQAPFDVIVGAAAVDHVPVPLIEQLALGGRLILPIGNQSQHLLMIEKDSRGVLRQSQVTAVRFVPMTGEAKRGH